MQALHRAPTPAAHTAHLTDRDLHRVAQYIGTAVGIQIPPAKRSLVEGRLRKRLRRLGFSDFKQYLDYALDARKGTAERSHLVDAITTNKTDFFREPRHFQYLMAQALPELERLRKLAGRRELSFWSAGCSSGEEVYSLAMVLCEAAEQRPGLHFSILGTDISGRALETAVRAIYAEQRVAPVPLSLRRKYLLRSRDRGEGLVRMGPQLRGRVRFGWLNLMGRTFGLDRQMDVIFCRNVMIYFSANGREALAQRFEAQLVSGGYLFVGHSESLNGLNTGLKQLSATVYRKQGPSG